MKKFKFPKLVSWMFFVAVAILFFMLIGRLIFFYHFRPAGYSFSTNLKVFALGLNFDLRIACGIVLFPFLIGNLYLAKNARNRLTTGSYIRVGLTVVVMGLLLLFMKKGHMPLPSLMYMAALFLLILVWLFTTKNCNPFVNRTSRTIFKIFFFIAIAILVIFYTIDFQHYDYLHQRLNASVLNYADDAKISAAMVWETYPVFGILATILACIALLYGVVLYSFNSVKKHDFTGRQVTKVFIGVIFTLVLGVGIFGRINQYPLRWSDAFTFEDDFKASLALNPIQSFLSTLQFRNSSYDLNKVKAGYPLMAEYLGINHSGDELNYQRSYHFTDSMQTPNVVVVICESFSMYKSTMAGNPLNTTPYFNRMCENGLFFDRCFTPSYGTARGVWGTITGIPDVEYPNTASRNPAYVDQHSIVNDYDGYEKFYFIGGSSSWANIRGLLNNNILNLNMYEEENFKSQTVDVWGISDKRLFLESNKVFKQQTKPFFAIIQTANNHRPYTIPDEDRAQLTLTDYPEDTLQKYGFQSNAELHAFRYSDFAFETFIETAKKEAYFKNTIFVFVGDHGIKGTTGGLMPPVWESQSLTAHHVPLLFYAPSIIAPARIEHTCSQLDLLPTVSTIARVSFTNSTLGRNLLDTIQNALPIKNSAFIFDPNLKAVGMVTDRYAYNYNLISGKKEFSSSVSLALEKGPEEEQQRKEIERLTDAFYETARYMLYNNKKSSLKK